MQKTSAFKTLINNLKWSWNSTQKEENRELKNSLQNHDLSGKKERKSKGKVKTCIATGNAKNMFNLKKDNAWWDTEITST